MKAKAMGTYSAAPWRLKQFDCLYIESAGGYQIAELIDSDSDPEAAPGLAEAEANARLIAQAPALLDYCERLLGFAHAHGDLSALAMAGGLMDGARAAINAARGE